MQSSFIQRRPGGSDGKFQVSAEMLATAGMTIASALNISGVFRDSMPRAVSH